MNLLLAEQLQRGLRVAFACANIFVPAWTRMLYRASFVLSWRHQHLDAAVRSNEVILQDA
jgi:hypothetical protein